MSALADVPFTPVPTALERLEGAVSPVVGIVTRTVATTSTSDESTLPNCASELASATRTLGAPTVAYGSGAHPDPWRARAAALGEAIERYSAMFVPGERLRPATAREVGDVAVHPDRFALFHPVQHAEPGFPFAPFELDTRTEFVEAFSLADGEAAYLPAQLVYLRQPVSGLRPIGYSTSSGLACAPTLAEAVLAALLELVERDAVMLAWKCRLLLPVLDWSEDDDLLEFDRRYFAPTGVPFGVIDGSAFLGVPIAIAVVHGPPGTRAALAVGAGAAATVAEAWLKAVSEGFGVYRWLGQQSKGVAAFQPEPNAIASFDEHMLFYARPEQAALAAFLDASAERTATRRVAPLEGTSPVAQIDALVARLARHGCSAYAVDVTSPDVRALGLRVARVISPELCALDVSHRARFLGGRRLYDAAYRAGVLPRPLTLDELNPLPHPFP